MRNKLATWAVIFIIGAIVLAFVGGPFTLDINGLPLVFGSGAQFWSIILMGISVSLYLVAAWSGSEEEAVTKANNLLRAYRFMASFVVIYLALYFFAAATFNGMLVSLICALVAFYLLFGPGPGAIRGL